MPSVGIRSVGAVQPRSVCASSLAALACFQSTARLRVRTPLVTGHARRRRSGRWGIELGIEHRRAVVRVGDDLRVLRVARPLVPETLLELAVDRGQRQPHACRPFASSTSTRVVTSKLRQAPGCGANTRSCARAANGNAPALVKAAAAAIHSRRFRLGKLELQACKARPDITSRLKLRRRPRSVAPPSRGLLGLLIACGEACERKCCKHGRRGNSGMKGASSRSPENECHTLARAASCRPSERGARGGCCRPTEPPNICIWLHKGSRVSAAAKAHVQLFRLARVAGILLRSERSQEIDAWT